MKHYVSGAIFRVRSRSMLLAAALSFTLSSAARAQIPTSTPTEPVACCGDINGDGVVSNEEVQACQGSPIPENPPPPAACDCNHDGVVTAGELTLIMYYFVNRCPGVVPRTATPTNAETPATPTPTPTPTCAPTGTPYCSDHCSPCPTIREGCYASACGQCVQKPVCASEEACVPGFGQCCACATFTPTATATPTTTVRPVGCIGDCNGDDHVTVDEILTGINMALGNASIEVCQTFNCCPEVCIPEIDCLMKAVHNALKGCRPATPTPTP